MSTQPLSFELHDAEGQPVLRIDDSAAGQSLSLVIRNTSDAPIVLKPLPAEPTDPYRFELVFRPGVLAADCKPALASDAGFTLSYRKDGQGHILPNPDDDENKHASSLFFAAADKTLEPGAEFRLQLTGLKANAAEGTRQTHVMLCYRNLWQVGGEQQVSGFKKTQLTLVDHRGKQDVPLLAGFVGANTVLNDGRYENKLRLRVSNASRKGEAIPAEARSRLVLVAESGAPDRVWTLAEDQELAGLRLCATHSAKGERKDMERVEGRTEWWAPLEPLNQGDYVDIEIEGLITGHPAGQAALYIRYEAIPGYRDGQQVVTVQRGPILLESGKVGINKKPGAALDVAGDLKTESLQVSGGRKAAAQAAVELDVKGRIGVRNTCAWDHLLLSHDERTAFIDAGGAEDGLALRVAAEVEGGYGDQPYREALRLKANGQATIHGFVGVNTRTPRCPLHIVGFKKFAHDAIRDPAISVKADAGIEVGAGLRQAADRRCQKWANPVSVERELDDILKISVIDFEYKDNRLLGAGRRKGLTASTVRDAFPNAYFPSNDYVPDIYGCPLSVELVGKDLILTFGDAHNLQSGDRIRLSAGDYLVREELVETVDDRKLKIKQWDGGVEDVFVYGRYVGDFESLDYSQILCSAIGAIQELSAQVTALQKELKALKGSAS